VTERRRQVEIRAETSSCPRSPVMLAT